MNIFAKNTLLLVLMNMLSGSVAQAAEPSHFAHFITRQGAQLMDGSQLFRFAGIHAPELHRIEDDARGVCKADPRGWGQYFAWPTPDEQANWISALVQTGAKAQRVYVFSVQQENDAACGRETHILAPATPDGTPRLNEKAMKIYDNMIAEADKQGLRLIVPFIDHWAWWGGREQLAAFYHEQPDDFYRVQSKTYRAYQQLIRQIITRTNTLTGRRYADEKAIMAWETGNELEETNAEFLQQTAALIKQLAPHQLVIDGTYKKINAFALADPNVDIVSNHYYTNAGNNDPDQVQKDLQAIGGKKVYLVGEFGLLDSRALNSIMQAIVHTDVNGAKAAGGLVWGFRGHRHNGGFYWHKEYTGHYSYHLPGFPVEGDANQEMAVVELVRHAAAQMDGKDKVPALPVPEAPLLRQASSPFALNWMGAAVGRRYDVERAAAPEGPWQTVGRDISDGVQAWDPATMNLFSDDYTSLKLGQTYYYRVLAKNESGISPPSNVIHVTHTQRNQAPQVTLADRAAVAQNRGLSLAASWQDDHLPTRQVTGTWSNGGNHHVHFCQANNADTRVWFTQPGSYQLTFTADDGLLQSSKNIAVTVTPANAPPPADFCHFDSGVLGVQQGTVTPSAGAETPLAITEDGFLGPFANAGDRVSWQIEAPWEGEFLLHLHVNGKWGSKKNSLQINGDKPLQIEFPGSNEQMTLRVSLRQGKNSITLGNYAGDWGFIFIKSMRVTA